MIRDKITTAAFALFTLAACGPDGTITATRRDQAPDMRSLAADMSRAITDMSAPRGADMRAPTIDMGMSAAEDMRQEDPPDMKQPPDMRPEEDMRMNPASWSQGCASGAGLTEGEHTFMLEDRERKFIVRLPQRYSTDRAWPLVLALHGNGGDAGYWDQTNGDRNIRGVLADDAVLIIAEAIDGKWRDYDLPSETWPARIESELLYFEEVISRANAQLCLDTNALFAMGFSGGGSFAGVLGCRRDDIRAFAAGGAVTYFDPSECTNTPAAWITIGEQELADARETYRDYWRDRAQCQATSAATDPAPCVAYDGCADDTPVHYCQHPGGHIWPGFGSQAMWSFFSELVEQ